MTPPMMAGELFERFGHQHPEVGLEWRQLGYPMLDAIAWLGDADAALCWMPPSGRGLACQVLRTSPLVAAVSERHPLAARDELTVEDLFDELFPGIVDWCDPVWLGVWGLDRYRGAPARRTEDRAVSPEEVASIVASGRAVTTVPEMVARPFHQLGIKSIPILDAKPVALTLVWPELTTAPLVRDLVAIAQQLTATADPVL
jgi:DNA-binding transcriptional LysR family regulator